MRLKNIGLAYFIKFCVLIAVNGHSLDSTAQSNKVVVAVMEDVTVMDHSMLEPYALSEEDPKLTLLSMFNQFLLSQAIEKIKAQAPNEGEINIAQLDEKIRNHADIETADYRKLERSVFEITHGTRVASLVVNSMAQSNFKLIHVPVPTDLLLKDLSLETLQKRLRILEQRLSLATEIFKKYNVRVVNLSQALVGKGITVDAKHGAAALEMILESEYMKQEYKERTKAGIELQKQEAQVYKQLQMAYEKFFADNPNVVFVMAAGNSGLSLEDLEYWSFPRIKAPNLIRVAAADYQGSIDKSSNYSADTIELAAPGVEVPGALVDGDKSRMSGTSMAAPLVTRELGRIFQSNPSLGVQQAIGKLLNERTVSVESLKGKVIGGRFLLPPMMSLSDKASLRPANQWTESDWIDFSCARYLQ